MSQQLAYLFLIALGFACIGVVAHLYI
jgi:hypothetical protein